MKELGLREEEIDSLGVNKKNTSKLYIYISLDWIL
jgi:hypothetical protein